MLGKQAKAFFAKNFLDISEEVRSALQIRLVTENLYKIKTASVLALIFMLPLLYLDYIRYTEGKMAVGGVYWYLFLCHVSLSVFAIYLAVIYYNKEKIKKEKEVYRFGRALVIAWMIALAFILIIMATFSVLERGSIMMYALYIVLINFVLTLFHVDRALLNIISFGVFMVGVWMINPNIDERFVTIFLESFSVTFIAFSLSTHIYNMMVKELMSEMALLDKNQQIEKARAESNRLLLNILPEKIAEELIQKGSVQPRNYASATVMMIDFKGFSRISNSMTSEELVATLDFCFSNFDRITLKYGIEKIKTMGDGYLCVGGVPLMTNDHPEKVIRAAFDILDFLAGWKKQQKEKNAPFFEGRIGIHTGQLTAGVVGETKFAYDVWGDTVNIAARIESGGEAGKINVSKNTYELIKDKFQCEHRGELPIKNLGTIEMYFISANP